MKIGNAKEGFVQLPANDTELWKLCADKARKVMWVLYESPADFPGRWVARFYVCDLDLDFRARGTKFCEIAGSQGEIEDALPHATRGRWKFAPEFDPANPQIIGVYK